MRAATLVAALVAAAALMAIGAGAAGAETIYNKIQNPFPGNVASLAFEATSTSEFGGEVEFAHTARTSPIVTVELSSWACQNLLSGKECKTAAGTSFEWPITLNVYEVGAGRAPGTLLATQTNSYKIPFRPSANNRKCTLDGEGVVGFGASCFSGKAFKVKFSLEGLVLPGKAIISVAYNTTDYGYHPTHEANIGEDSLNVGLYEGGESSETVGSSPFPNDAYLNSTWSGAYCNGAEGTGTFRLDSGCWSPYQPAFEVQAKAH